ncbi:hypothetical protein C8Q75DRAFT_517132 [Abortiporus biennis]|nr:hypothetical protein C8Q75DRAFT_517132 [Abortiporus biennis]
MVYGLVSEWSIHTHGYGNEYLVPTVLMVWTCPRSINATEVFQGLNSVEDNRESIICNLTVQSFSSTPILVANMVDWTSDKVQDICAFVYARLSAVTLGIYLWYWIRTLRHVEIPLITMRLRFSIVHIPYLLGRYFVLASGFMVILVTQGTPISQCFGINKGLASLASLTICCSSTNILLRPIALWKHNYYMLVFLVILATAQWSYAFVVLSSTVQTKFTAPEPACNGTAPFGPHTAHAYTKVTSFFFYTVFYDTTILLATVAGLWCKNAARTSRLWTTLYKQGLWYLVVTIVCNVPLLVFSWLDLNVISLAKMKNKENLGHTLSFFMG